VDDFALFGDDKGQLQEARSAVEEYLGGLRLRIHPVKSQLFETRHGATFLGFRVLPDRIRFAYRKATRRTEVLRSSASYRVSSSCNNLGM
jgi:hypothetical protein